MPSNDPLVPLVDDILNDSAAYVAAIPSLVNPLQANMGWVPVGLPSAFNNRSIEPWMHSIMWICASMEAWRNERPEWLAFLQNYFVKQVPAILDTAQGGCDGNADAQWQVVSSTAGTGFAAGFYQTPLEQLEALYTKEPWDSTTCGNHTGLLYGIGSAQAAKWVAYGSAGAPGVPLPPQQYYMMARAAQSMGGVLGITLSSNIAKRITARISQVGPVNWSIAPQTSTQTNYVQWAIVEPDSHS